MHQHVRAGEFLLDDLLADARRHRNGGDARSADNRVDFAAGHDLHDLAKDDAARRAEYEGDEAEEDDLNRGDREERVRVHRTADGDSEEYRRSVEDFVLRGLREALSASALAEQVAEHQHTDKGNGRRKDEAAGDRRDYREEDALGARDGAELLHLDAAVLLRRKELDDRGLNERDERHVAVSGDRDRGKNGGSQLRAEVDSRRAVSAADDADTGRFLNRKAHEHSADDRDKNAELRRSAEQERHGVRKQRAEVGQSADAHEYDDRVNLVTDTEHDVIKESALVDNAGKRQVNYKAAESYRHKKKRLKVLRDGEIQKNKGNEKHQQVSARKSDEPRLIQNSLQSGHIKFHDYLASEDFLSKDPTSLFVPSITIISPIMTRKTMLIAMKDITSAPDVPEK